MQAGLTKAMHQRLYFSYGIKDAGFEGVAFVEAQEKVNTNSLPDEMRSKYWGVVFQNSDGEVLHSSLLDKSYYYQKLDDAPEYYVTSYRGTFFLDIPENIDLSETIGMSLVDLNTHKQTQFFPIDDMNKEYSNPFQNEEGWSGEKKVYKVYGNADASMAFDFVVLTEGFTSEELQMQTLESLLDSKFGGYLKSYILPLLDTQPYKSLKDKVNIWVVATPSLESGVSNPFQNKKRLTTYRATYGAFCSQRSLVVRDQKRALEMASLTPFDQAIVLVNDETYGGQGSDIATFSVNKQAPYLIKHELAHAVGLLADEYKYFSDTRNHSSCEDHLMETYASHTRKNWGRNSYYENQNWLAPNLSGSEDPTQVKWASLLTEDSPVVLFDYPENDSVIDKEERSISAKFIAHYDREDLLITMGLLKDLNFALTHVKELTINGVATSFEEIRHNEGQLFLKVSGFKVSKGQNLDIKLNFQDIEDKYLEWIKYSSSSYHLLTLPSTEFEGSVNEIGIFQGSNVDPYKTYRSSYHNIMNSSSEMAFDKWQEQAYRSIVEYFITQSR